MASVNPVANDIFTVNGVPLKLLLAKAERVKKVKAFLLIVPLLVFLIVTFVFPIFSMLYRSILNPEMGIALPNFSSQILQWETDDFPPPPALLKVFVEDVLLADENRTIGRAAKRLNYNRSGFRSLMKKTGKKLGKAFNTAGKEAVVNDPNLWERLLEIDKRWNDPEYWATMKQESSHPEMGGAMRKFSKRVMEWEIEEFPPPPDLLKIFVEDVLEAKKKLRIGAAAKHLNDRHSGFRSLIEETGTKLRQAFRTAGAEAVVNVPDLWDQVTKLDKRWKDPEYWVIMKQASPPTTAWFFAASHRQGLRHRQ